MPRIDEEDIRRVREASDIVALVSERVVLKQKGRLFWGCCPFHDEKTPSFKIDPDTQLWHCFGCGKGGDVFGYVMESDNVDFPEAVSLLAERAHIEIRRMQGSGPSRDKRERLMQACQAAEGFYHRQLMRTRGAGPDKARAYLHGRGFGSQASKHWKLGYAPGRGALVRFLNEQGFTRSELLDANLAYDRNGVLSDRFFERVMFPVHDVQGRTVAFGGRVIGEGEPKYLNSSETPVFRKSENLYGIDRAKGPIVTSARAIVVEGYTDVIALHEAGVCNAVATLGTALTAQHVKLLSRFATTIVYLFDGDEAGQRAAARASEFIDWQSAVESRRDPIDLRVAVLPDGKDPAEYVADAGAQALRDVLTASEPLLQYCINRCLDSFDVRKPEQKAHAMRKALEILYPIRLSVTATDYVNLIADRLNVSYEAVSEALCQLKAPATARRHDAAESAPGERRAAVQATGRIVQADERWIRTERTLISLCVSYPDILQTMAARVMRIDWADEACEHMADALCSLPAQSSPAQALQAAQAAYPEAPRLLAEVMDDQDGETAAQRAELLARSLRERDVERQVRSCKARMRTEAGLDADELDALFEKTVALQKELAQLRSDAAALA